MDRIDTHTQDVLLLILAGYVVSYSDRTDLGPVPDADRSRYLEKVEWLVAHEWAMPSPTVSPDGGWPLILTTVGSHRLLGLNPNRYESRTAIEFVDGKFEAVAR